ncbi:MULTISPECIES: flagellar biosynthetic protein FliO [Methylomonas]|uniref:Flagellar protein n=2 Tax=Methylomonas TaxID=416 RepID=A0A126T5J5_9GAMM|nr:MULTISPECIES: flagellar biosynthetic protein FliO [Methylomonas]AMK77330.1 flagellar biosynthetic protein FliO [Methylomonas denitrificans]OAI08834.1 flagellar biosynthetic protein FliO [Methylomonas methanica]TCV75676.1 flagellar protein FliO/FliZ [Methylomonas methanica]
MSVSRLISLIVSVLIAPVAWADDTAALPRQTAKVVSSGDVAQWLLALLLVLAVFFLSVWLLRKSGGLAFVGKSQLAVLAGLSLGMREKLVLVKVGEKQLLLGVSSGRIDKLLELEGDQRLFMNSAEGQETSVFAKKLLQVMQGKNHD